MPRTVRDKAIGTRESRLKLKSGLRHWRGIHEGLALCYRRGGQGSGTWSARLKRSDGRYALRGLGSADDHAPANGVDVLTFAQAQQRALIIQEQVKRDQGIITRPATVAEAAENYMAWFREHRKSVTGTEHCVRVHILPALGQRRIENLRAPELREWLYRLAARPARIRTSRFGKPQRFKAAPKTADQKRARRSSANRILSVAKAMLNKAFRDGLVSDNVEWRKVLPFKNADEARIRFLTDAEAVRLVNACPADLRALVRAALLTGARYGELVALKAQDVDLRSAKIYLAPAKSGRARHVPLNPEGVTLFRTLATGKTGDALVFSRPNGAAWGRITISARCATPAKQRRLSPASPSMNCAIPTLRI